MAAKTVLGALPRPAPQGSCPHLPPLATPLCACDLIMLVWGLLLDKSYVWVYMSFNSGSCDSENEKLNISTDAFPYLNGPLTLSGIGIRETENSYISDFNDLNENLSDISSLKVNMVSNTVILGISMDVTYSFFEN